MDYLLPYTRLGLKFKHAKGVDIVMGDIYLLSTYPRYWKAALVPHILIGKLNSSFKLSQGWTCHQVDFLN